MQNQSKPKYELHIAIPKIPPETALAILSELKETGITDSDYFLRLINVPIDGQPCPIDPTTHDISSPMVITSTFFDDTKQVIEKTLKGMAVLTRHGVVGGNFELEAMLGDQDQNVHPTITDFSGFKQQHGSPAYENHILWDGPADTLPTDEDIIQDHRTIFGYPPNQIADFALQPNPGESETVWRVSTVYQATPEAAAAFAKRAADNMHRLHNAKKFIAEKICVVSDPGRE